ncbi:MAG: hypothetical protein M3070_07995 [Actinomycetota bacterium]|nr:hypothetical protein [Actinomycetota bacterium]
MIEDDDDSVDRSASKPALRNASSNIARMSHRRLRPERWCGPDRQRTTELPVLGGDERDRTQIDAGSDRPVTR